MTREEIEKIPTPEDTDVAPLPVIGPDGETDEDVEARLAYESLMRHRAARRKKKLVVAGVAVAIVLVAAIGWAVASGAGSTADDAPTLQTMPLSRGEFSESVQATGTAQPISSVVVTPEVDGIIETVNVSEGSVVNEGDVLLTIRNDELDRAVREAEIGVRSANAELASAKEAYNQTYRAYQAGGTTVTDPETGESVEVEAGASWADVQQAQAGIDSAQLSLESAQQALDQAVATADKRTIGAPASGSVVVMNAVPGAGVGSSATAADGSAGPLVQIADLTQMTVSVQVNEVDISRIAVGQEARVSFSALPGVMLAGEVTRISTVAGADEYGMNYGVVTYGVEILIPEPVAELKPGMTASVEIMMQSVPDALTVPASALMTDDGESYYLYVMTDPETQACERRDVSVTAQSSTTAVVEGDLSEGDLVVLDAYSVDPTTVSAGSGSGAGTEADVDELAGEEDATSAEDAVSDEAEQDLTDEGSTTDDSATTDAPAA